MNYLIKFKIAGHWATYYPNGNNMENTLDQAKQDIKRIFGKVDSIIIYNLNHINV